MRNRTPERCRDRIWEISLPLYCCLCAVAQHQYLATSGAWGSSMKHPNSCTVPRQQEPAERPLKAASCSFVADYTEMSVGPQLWRLLQSWIVSYLPGSELQISKSPKPESYQRRDRVVSKLVGDIIISYDVQARPCLCHGIVMGLIGVDWDLSWIVLPSH